MSQVRIGTVDVTNGSQVVSGSGTNWLSSVSANDLFIIQGESVIYRIASVASDTQLSLSSNYVGVTATALPYVVHIDFTTSGIPLMQDGDIETVSIYNLAVVSLEQGLAFGTYYLGAFAVAPTTTGTGGAITEGMMYFDTVTDLLNVYNGSVWYSGAVAAIDAAQSAAEAAADAILTAADRVQTGLDRVQTTSDRIQTISDAAQTASDRVQTGLDRTQTNLDVTQTTLDAAATAADRVQTTADAVQTNLDVTQTILDAAQTASDRVQTGLDETQTGLDAIQTISDAAQTVSDAAATAADRVQTGLDSTQTGIDAASTAADRTYVDGVEANVAAIEVSINNTFDTFDDRFLGTFTTDPTHDNDGNAISVGAVYYNSVELATKFYNGSSWDDPSQSASTSATNALNSENAAALSETNSATSESNAATSETNAAASESAASTSEGNAATSASASSSSAAASSNSATAAAASYDSFDDRYLGPKASDPTLDNDGSALLSGAMYWSTSEDVMKVYTGSLWKLVSTVVEGVYQVTEFTNIATQTTLTITYDVGLTQVLYNGVQLNFSDFTATNGTTIVLASPIALADDVVTVILWGAVTSSSLVGTAAAFNTGVTTGTIPFAEDVVLVDAGGNIVGDISLGDNDKLLLGDSDDLQIYHDGSNSYIKETGIGYLTISSGTDLVLESAGGEKFIHSVGNEGVTSYYNGIAKLATTNTGISVTGEVSATQAEFSGSGIQLDNAAQIHTWTLDDNFNSRFNIGTSSAGANWNFGSNNNTYLRVSPAGIDVTGEVLAGSLEISGAPATYNFSAGTDPLVNAAIISDNVNAGTGPAIVLGSVYSASNTVANARIFAERQNTGSTNAGATDLIFEVGQASGSALAERLRITEDGNFGIGTSSPTAPLHTVSSENLVAKFSSSDVTSGIRIEDTTTSYDFYVDSGNLRINNTAGSEKMRLDSAGNALFGKTTADNTTAGTTIYNDNGISVVRNSNVTAIFNRLNTDGDILQLRKDGTSVGQIGNTGSDLYIGTGDVGLSFYDYSTENAIFPHNPSTNSPADALIDLGRGVSGSERRFKDLHLSGTANIGGHAKMGNGYSYGWDDLTTRITGNSSTELINMYTAGSERLRIDNSGNLLVGKTAVSLGAVGVEVKPYGEVRATADGAQALQLNRLTSDGTIIDLRKDGTTVGSIGTNAETLYVSAPQAGGMKYTYLNSTNAVMIPVTTTGANADAVHDLGYSGARFKDLYLSGTANIGGHAKMGNGYSYGWDDLTTRITGNSSTDLIQFYTNGSESLRIDAAGDVELSSGTGGIYLGGRAAANRLDHYEEGNWTPVLSRGGTPATLSFGTSPTYTKVGRLVTLSVYINGISNFPATGGNAVITGLPFASSGWHTGNIAYGSATNCSNTTWVVYGSIGYFLTADNANFANVSIDLNRGMFTITYQTA